MYFDPILSPLALPDHPTFLISQLHALFLKNKSKDKAKARKQTSKKEDKKTMRKIKFTQNRTKHFLLAYYSWESGGGWADLEYD